MKLKTKIKSKLSRTFSGNFPEAYKKFTMSHMHDYTSMPETRLHKPLSECKVALLSTAGIHLVTDSPFDVDNPAGDPTFRIIPADAQEDQLTVTHLFIDTKHAKRDPTIVFPLPQLKELAADGMIGSVSPIHIGLNGGILDTAEVEREWIPKVVELLRREEIDVALLVPG